MKIKLGWRQAAEKHRFGTLLEAVEAWRPVSHLPLDFSVCLVTRSKSGFERRKTDNQSAASVTECGSVKHTKSVRDNPHEQHHLLLLLP